MTQGRKMAKVANETSFNAGSAQNFKKLILIIISQIIKKLKTGRISAFSLLD
jgi:hypothetical protein